MNDNTDNLRPNRTAKRAFEPAGEIRTPLGAQKKQRVK